MFLTMQAVMRWTSGISLPQNFIASSKHASCCSAVSATGGMRYSIEIGGTLALIEVALKIPPWEPMHQLARKELRAMKMANTAFKSF